MTDRNHTPDEKSNSSPGDTEGENEPPAQSPVEVFHSEYDEDESPSEAVVSAVEVVETPLE